MILTNNKLFWFSFKKFIKVSTCSIPTGLYDYEYETVIFTDIGSNIVDTYKTKQQAVDGHDYWCNVVGIST